MDSFDGVKIPLYPHQITSIKNMENRELNKTIDKNKYFYRTSWSILGDRTGYGKTMSVLGLVARDKMDYSEETALYSSRSFRITTPKRMRYKIIPTTLIVVPISVCGSWADEIRECPSASSGNREFGY